MFRHRCDLLNVRRIISISAERFNPNQYSIDIPATSSSHLTKSLRDILGKLARPHGKPAQTKTSLLSHLNMASNITDIRRHQLHQPQDHRREMRHTLAWPIIAIQPLTKQMMSAA